MFVILLAAALFYPAQTCSSKNDDERDTHVFHGITRHDEEQREARNRHVLVGPGPSDGRPQSKRKSSDELSAKKNEILRLAYELPLLFNYYDILRNENDLMENKRTQGPNYSSYPRYFGYEF